MRSNYHSPDTLSRIFFTSNELISKKSSIHWNPNDQITESLKVLHKLGAGGFGDVYCAKNLLSNNLVAVKRIKPSQLNKVNNFFFFKELITWSDLPDHPNILKCFYYRYLDSNELIIISEYAENLSINVWLSNSINSNFLKIIRAGIEISWGLSFLHSLNLVHRDIKPSNILITKNGIPKISDFGISSVLLDGEFIQTHEADQRFTMAFCSPEQLEKNAFSTSSDIYSFALTLLSLTVGAVFWDYSVEITDSSALDIQAYIVKHSKESVDPLFSEMISKCLRRDPEARPTSLDVATDLINILEKTTKGKLFKSKPEVDLGKKGAKIPLFQMRIEGDRVTKGAWYWGVKIKLIAENCNINLNLNQAFSSERGSIANEIASYLKLIDFVQNDIPESLESLEILARLQEELGLGFEDSGDFEAAKNALQHAIEIWVKIENTFEGKNVILCNKLQAHLLLGRVQSKNGNFHESISNFDICSRGFNDLRVNGSAKNFILDIDIYDRKTAIYLGNAYFDYGKYLEAIDVYRAALSIKKPENESIFYIQDIVRLNFELGLTYQRLNRLDTALEFYNISIDYAEKNFNEAYTRLPNYADLLFQRGTILTDNGSHDFALREFERAYKIVKDYNSDNFFELNLYLSRIKNSKAITLERLNRDDEATALFLDVAEERAKWIEEDNRTNLLEEAATPLLNLEGIYLKKGDFKSARDIRLKAYQFLVKKWENTSDIVLLLKITKMLQTTALELHSVGMSQDAGKYLSISIVNLEKTLYGGSKHAANFIIEGEVQLLTLYHQVSFLLREKFPVAHEKLINKVISLAEHLKQQTQEMVVDLRLVEALVDKGLIQLKNEQMQDAIDSFQKSYAKTKQIVNNLRQDELAPYFTSIFLKSGSVLAGTQMESDLENSILLFNEVLDIAETIPIEFFNMDSMDNWAYAWIGLGEAHKLKDNISKVFECTLRAQKIWNSAMHGGSVGLLNRYLSEIHNTISWLEQRNAKDLEIQLKRLLIETLTQLNKERNDSGLNNAIAHYKRLYNHF